MPAPTARGIRTGTHGRFGKAVTGIGGVADLARTRACSDGGVTGRVEQLRAEHRLLREQVEELSEAARTIGGLDHAGREAVRRRVVDYLREHVEPHTWVDERVLYPQVTERLGDPLATASMNYDHLAIRRWIDDLAVADVADAARLQQLLYGLQALITVHMWKEDELYLAALESPSWPN
jgi:glycogen debranching enzyme